ncbi:MAG: hypothetical protein MJ016_01275 [Victivallaceae bacterium]|nr:hypothetical protein [Victivallaceae bacterium]
MKRFFHFSFANPEQFRAIGRKKLSSFSGVELPGELLNGAPSAAEKFPGCGIRDLVSSRLARLIPYENNTIQSEFLKVFSDRCRMAAARGACRGTADFDLARALADKNDERRFRLLLRGLFGALEENGLTLLLPVRFPRVPGSADAAAIRDFCRGMLYPRLGIYIDFYPHEPGAFDFGDALRALRFDAESWRIHFEPERGNQLTVPLMEKLFSATDHLPLKSIIFAIAPGNTVPDAPAMAALQETLGRFNDTEP